jgi:uncharacterized tellurite resistance protein B-like protein
MHVVLAVITAVAGLMWAMSSLQRSGFNLNSLNPFAMVRRWQWRKIHGGKPIYKLDSTLDVAAVLLLGVAKADGDITSDQKQFLLGLFQKEFELSRDEAADLLLAASHLIRDQIYIVDDLSRILERSSSKFSSAQVTSLLAMMRSVAVLDGAVNKEQQKLIDATEGYFNAKFGRTRRWS